MSSLTSPKLHLAPFNNPLISKMEQKKKRRKFGFHKLAAIRKDFFTPATIMSAFAVTTFTFSFVECSLPVFVLISLTSSRSMVLVQLTHFSPDIFFAGKGLSAAESARLSRANGPDKIAFHTCIKHNSLHENNAAREAQCLELPNHVAISGLSMHAANWMHFDKRVKRPCHLDAVGFVFDVPYICCLGSVSRTWDLTDSWTLCCLPLIDQSWWFSFSFYNYHFKDTVCLSLDYIGAIRAFVFLG